MQHSVERPAPAKPIVIDVRGEPLGVLIPSHDGFRFVAVKLPVFGIDGRVFATVDDARAAAAEVAGEAAR